LDRLTPRRRGQVYAVLAGLTWSSAGILQVQLTVGVGTQLAGRSLFACLALLALVAWSGRNGGLRASLRALGRPGLAVAFFTAVTSAAFIAAFSYTSVANVLFFQATCPIIAALLGVRFLGERLRGATFVAMALSLLGVLLMVGGPGGGSAFGDALAFVSTASFAIVVVLCRRRPEVSMVPALCLAQLFVLAATLPFFEATGLDAGQVGWLFLLGAGQLALGQVFFVAAARRMPAAEGALIVLLEIVLGPLWVWLAGYQPISTTTLIGGAVILAAVVIQVRNQPPAPGVPPAPGGQ
jgi:drug/metabolite transporter (DMT)-like permease